MTSLSARLPGRQSNWLRLFVERLLWFAVAWLAVTGLVETVQSGDYPRPWIIAAAIIGSAIGALIRPSSSQQPKAVAE